MNKLFFLSISLLVTCSVTVSAQSTTTSVKGRNTGTTITQHPNGGSTTKIGCDNFYQDECYTMTTVGMQGTLPYTELRYSTPRGNYEVLKMGRILNYQKIEQLGHTQSLIEFAPLEF